MREEREGEDLQRGAAEERRGFGSESASGVNTGRSGFAAAGAGAGAATIAAREAGARGDEGSAVVDVARQGEAGGGIVLCRFGVAFKTSQRAAGFGEAVQALRC